MKFFAQLSFKKARFLFLVMVISVTIDVQGSVELFKENDAHELVGKGHGGEGETEVAGGFNVLRKPVCAADNQTDSTLTCGRGFGAQSGKIGRGKLLALDAQRDLITLVREGGQQFFIVLQLYRSELTVSAQTLFVFFTGIAEIIFPQRAYTYDFDI